MSIEKLKKLLFLEAKRGYKNDSVIGGFSKFVIDYIAKTIDSRKEELTAIS